MTKEQWADVDRYLAEALITPDPVLEEAMAANSRANLPAIDVTPTQGKLLYLLALTQGAKRILEFGTLGGYSTIWLARALPTDGLLVTLEADPLHAKVAAENIERSGLTQKVRILTGKALDLMPTVQDEYGGGFDLIFIDADKTNTTEYFRWATKLGRAGSLVIVDNVIRNGEVANAGSPDPNVQGMRRFLASLADYPKVQATAIQTVGAKGYDGFVLARLPDTVG